ncbi:T-cell-interacting, activating receptor on myeloid cells protein 1 [Galemys pyrenaicus]|nr:T-cell-interacting, activating receptor on myeloid cells protein 1 [Galemys pyrenaicus]
MCAGSTGRPRCTGKAGTGRTLLPPSHGSDEREARSADTEAASPACAEKPGERFRGGRCAAAVGPGLTPHDNSSAGLCVGHGDTAGGGPLPRPSLTAWPSSVVPDRGEVMLTCHAPTRDPVKFVLKRARQRVGDVPSPELTEGLAQFRLTGLTTHEAGKYTCEYHREVSPKTASPPSEALLLLVTGAAWSRPRPPSLRPLRENRATLGPPCLSGHFLKPSLQAHPWAEVTAGENVTLRCQRPRHVTESTHFALLKAGAPAPTQVSAARNGAAEFSLVSVTARDSGNYSCVHYMTRPPFWASRPSDAISIQVTGELLHQLEDVPLMKTGESLLCPSDTRVGPLERAGPHVSRRRVSSSDAPAAASEDYAHANLVRLGLAALVVVILGVFVVEAWCGQKSPAPRKLRRTPRYFTVAEPCLGQPAARSVARARPALAAGTCSPPANANFPGGTTSMLQQR